MSSLFDKFDANLLITTIVLVFWKTISWKQHNKGTGLSARINLFGNAVGGWLLGAGMAASIVTNACLVAFFFLFVKYTISTTYWTFPVVYSLFVASMLLSKGWNVLHFRMGAERAATMVNFVLFGFATTIWAVIVADRETNLGAQWYTPFALFSVYWLGTLAAMIGRFLQLDESGNLSFRFRVPGSGHRSKHHHHHADKLLADDFDTDLAVARFDRTEARIGAAAPTRTHKTPVPV
jgi:hypothetical protein